MTDLEGEIQFWEATLKQNWFVLDASTKTLIETTIKHLKELQALKGEA